MRPGEPGGDGGSHPGRCGRSADDDHAQKTLFLSCGLVSVAVFALSALFVLTAVR
jgi:hypothetical protein